MKVHLKKGPYRIVSEYGATLFAIQKRHKFRFWRWSIINEPQTYYTNFNKCKGILMKLASKPKKK